MASDTASTDGLMMVSPTSGSARLPHPKRPMSPPQTNEAEEASEKHHENDDPWAHVDWRYYRRPRSAAPPPRIVERPPKHVRRPHPPAQGRPLGRGPVPPYHPPTSLTQLHPAFHRNWRGSGPGHQTSRPPPEFSAIPPRADLRPPPGLGYSPPHRHVHPPRAQNMGQQCTQTTQRPPACHENQQGVSQRPPCRQTSQSPPPISRLSRTAAPEPPPGQERAPASRRGCRVWPLREPSHRKGIQLPKESGKNSDASSATLVGDEQDQDKKQLDASRGQTEGGAGRHAAWRTDKVRSQWCPTNCSASGKQKDSRRQQEEDAKGFEDDDIFIPNIK